VSVASPGLVGEPAAPAMLRRARGFGRRRRGPITIVVSLASAAVLVALLAGRRAEFVAALSSAGVWVLAATTLLQIVALVARSEAWHLTIGAAGGTVDRRALYRASSMQVLGSLVTGQLGAAARIAALRRSSPTACPKVPTLIAAELPILAVEAMLAALASFTLVVPLGLPWWLPIVGFAVVGGAAAGLRHLAIRTGGSCGVALRCSGAPGAVRAWSRSCSSGFSLRSCGAGCCCVRSASMRRCSMRPPW
jgi:uncharacterized membrane protein YbhN (UPF0104 family)